MNLLYIQKYVYSYLNFPKNGISSKLTENFRTIVSNFSDSSPEILSYVSLKFADNHAKNKV